jgi:trehalose/maltose hydrolase-like predicted phosphorylase
MVHPNEYLGAGQGLAVPTKIIKQADVVMMLNLFRTRFSSTEIKKAELGILRAAHRARLEPERLRVRHGGGRVRQPRLRL